MGLYDVLTFEDGLDVAFPDPDVDPIEQRWQTKSLGMPAMDTYKVTMDGRLFRREVRTEFVPEEERPLYDKDLGGFESDWEALSGMVDVIPEGWSDTEHHGMVEFHATIDDEYVSFEAKFTDGELEEIRQNDRRCVD